MILFFQSSTKTVLAVEAAHAFSPEDTQKLVWLFSEATPVQSETLEGWYVGPRREFPVLRNIFLFLLATRITIRCCNVSTMA